jgi:hypothetical protein
MSRFAKPLGLLVVFGALLAALAAVPASAVADTLTVDFESGPPIGTAVTDDYLASAFVRFLAADDGFRPYRRAAPGQAHSGTVVADVGPDDCVPEGGTGADCEFVTGGTTGRLARTASAVTLYAGLFSAVDPSQTVTVRLVAYDANDQIVATGAPVAIDASGFDKLVTVASAAGNIARFTLVVEGSGRIGAPVGFDDLTLDFPANSLPDVSLSVPSAVAAVLQGKTTDVPLDLTRLNGSDGPVRVSVSGLPTGVTATVGPNPVPGTQGTATLHLAAAADAPPFDVPATATIAADPQGNANVAPGARSRSLLLRVASSYELRAPGGTSVSLPDCAPVDVPLVLARDRAFTGTVTLGVEGLPTGVSARILPSATIAPGGGFDADATLRLSHAPGAALPRDVVVRASSPGAADRTLALHLAAAARTATLASGLGLTPRHLGPGTTIRIDGNGFCAGTRVQVGNAQASADAVVAPDGHSLTFGVPRLATTGPVTIVPPAGATYPTSGPLKVDSFRNGAGFQFHNPSFGSLSISELTDAFGADDLFIKINPCWPFGDCTIVTGILNPLAAIDWGVLDIALRESGGHCFGISRAVEQLLNHKTPYARFAGGAGAANAFSLTGASGPSSGLGSYLDAQHATQGSAEFLHAYLNRADHVSAQLARVHQELAAGRDPFVTIHHGGLLGEGHAVLAYDEQPTADGADVYVYDSNRQFDPGEDGNAAAHKGNVEGSVVHFDTVRGTWSFTMAGGDVWSGGNDGSLFVAPQSTIPDDPSLPGIGTIGDAVASLFGSASGAVTTTGASAGAEYLPALDSHATPGGGGWWLTKRTGAPLEVRFRGVRSGTYSQAFTSAGFVRAVTNVATARGVRDAATGLPSGRRGHAAVRFQSGRDRPLSIALASRPSGAGASGGRATSAAAAQPTTWAATIATHAFAHGSDSAGLTPSGGLTYGHDGAATTLSFSLQSVSRDRGPARFESPTVRVAAGDRVSVRPLGGDLERVRLAVRHRNGRTTRSVVRNRAKAAGRLGFGTPRLRGRQLRVPVRVAGLRDRAVLGVSLQLSRGGREVAHREQALTRLGNGSRTLTWRLPRGVRKGSYRLVANARLATAGLSAGSVRAARRATVRIR